MADIDYTKSASESIDQYNTRIATARAANGSTPAPTNTASDFVGQLQQKLLGQSDIISSENTNLENKINEAISGIQKGAEASAAAITSQYDREIGYAKDQGDSMFTSALEAQRGFAQNTAGLKQLATETDKQLKDMEMRKQELILQGNAAAAGKISDLQLQAIQFRQQAQQQVFANLLGMANFGLQAQQQETQRSQFERQQNFQEQQAIGTVALEYGLTVKPGDTIESIVSRAMPLASKQKQLELQAMQAQINESNANIRRINAEAAAGAKVSSAPEIDILARGYLNGADLGLIKNPETQSLVVTRAVAMQKEDVLGAVGQFVGENISMSEANRRANAAYSNNPVLLEIAKAEIAKQYGSKTPAKGTGGVKFTPPGQLPQGGLKNVKPWEPSSPEAVEALRNSLLGTGLSPSFR